MECAYPKWWTMEEYCQQSRITRTVTEKEAVRLVRLAQNIPGHAISTWALAGYEIDGHAGYTRLPKMP